MVEGVSVNSINVPALKRAAPHESFSFKNPFESSIDELLDSVGFSAEAKVLIQNLHDIQNKIKAQDAAFNKLRLQALEQQFEIYNTLGASGTRGLIGLVDEATNLAQQISRDLGDYSLAGNRLTNVFKEITNS